MVVPYLNVEARWEDAPDQGLLGEKGGRGFPYCTIMNADGEVIWEVRPESADVFSKAVANANKLAGFQAKVAKNPEDKVAAASAALLDAIGRQQRQEPDLDDLVEHTKVEGVDKEILAAFEAWREEKAMMKALRRPSSSYEFFKNTPPKNAEGLIGAYFYLQVAMGAVDEEDAKTAKDVFARAQKIIESDEAIAKRLARFVEQVEKKMKEIDG